MCGIVGIVGLQQKINNSQTIYAMMDVQRHRGPDDEGAVEFDFDAQKSHELRRGEHSVGLCSGILGFNRLSIRDVSMAGHQPMRDITGQVILVFNGEIYNSEILKRDLIRDGYNFKSKTDTEVILALYLKIGFEKMIKQLNGMFGLCIVDLRKHSIYLARDRFGIKPLYYMEKQGAFFFASEYKSILEASQDTRELDIWTLSEYFNFRNSVSRTLIKNIKSLLPGEMITIENGGEVRKKKYYDVNDYKIDDSLGERDKEITDEIYDRLRNAVKTQLVSDVAVGCQLSGGIDSSIISYIANAQKNTKMDSVSIIFQDERFTEKQWIEYVGEKLGVEQHKFLFDERQFIDTLEKSVWHMETVVTHPNSLCLFELTGRAREYVTVLLSGEGADELFAGYSRYGLGMQCKDAETIVRKTTTIPKELRQMIFPDILDQEVLEERLATFDKYSGTVFDKQRKYEFENYMPELLIRQDKMSMANSIENRVPFLDNNLVDFVMQLPSSVLCEMRNGEVYTKKPLKKISTELYGKDFTERKKMGFSVPIQNYLHNKEFDEYFYDWILPGIKRHSIFDARNIQCLYENISAKSYKYVEVEAFWRVLTTEIWCQLYLDGCKK